MLCVTYSPRYCVESSHSRYHLPGSHFTEGFMALEKPRLFKEPCVWHHSKSGRFYLCWLGSKTGCDYKTTTNIKYKTSYKNTSTHTSLPHHMNTPCLALPVKTAGALWWSQKINTTNCFPVIGPHWIQMAKLNLINFARHTKGSLDSLSVNAFHAHCFLIWAQCVNVCWATSDRSCLNILMKSSVQLHRRDHTHNPAL